MRIARQVVVFDAANLAEESTFWVGLLGGTVDTEDDWHSISVDGEPRMGIQLAPQHVPPDWPHGEPQQIHLDLYVDDITTAHAEAMALGARLLKPAEQLEAADRIVAADSGTCL
ncbi:MAG TPA: glyoxalase [Microbacteriaceae bacterium]|jgi:predicted enzyme related to lactoylglutathione lyase|nr:glyoxalase [Microbacteriaceae bacterium]